MEMDRVKAGDVRGQSRAHSGRSIETPPATRDEVADLHTIHLDRPVEGHRRNTEFRRRWWYRRARRDHAWPGRHTRHARSTAGRRSATPADRSERRATASWAAVDRGPPGSEPWGPTWQHQPGKQHGDEKRNGDASERLGEAGLQGRGADQDAACEAHSEQPARGRPAQQAAIDPPEQETDQNRAGNMPTAPKSM